MGPLGGGGKRGRQTPGHSCSPQEDHPGARCPKPLPSSPALHPAPACARGSHGNRALRHPPPLRARGAGTPFFFPPSVGLPHLSDPQGRRVAWVCCPAGAGVLPPEQETAQESGWPDFQARLGPGRRGGKPLLQLSSEAFHLAGCLRLPAGSHKGLAQYWSWKMSPSHYAMMKVRPRKVKGLAQGHRLEGDKVGFFIPKRAHG